jgi:hypothetical protein
MKKVVKKDFLTLLKGDVITFSINMDNVISLSVENREIDVPFYGNKNGSWGKNNPIPKGMGVLDVKKYKPNTHFIWVKEPVEPFTVMEFKIPSRPKNLKMHMRSLYSGDKWNKIYTRKIINDLKSQGVF